MKKLYYENFNTIGSDPELFFIKDSKVVPSSEVVPEDGQFVIRDGFQGELNPLTAQCRQYAGSYIAQALRNAFRYARSVGAEVSFDVGHIISDDVWSKTGVGMRRFGCNPTMNAHNARFKRVTGIREKFRAAGGHLHFSLSNPRDVDMDKLVTVMDIVLGNTCVLIDRDPNNARRRKNYGVAGEYRQKSYGLEYRVLSNFWLRSYTLWSMVSQLGRNSIDIYNQKLADELIGMFDMRKVRKAINENDYELALENFLILKKFICNHEATGNGLDHLRMDKLESWLTSKEPLKNWNTLAKIENDWLTKLETAGVGFERFIDNYYKQAKDKE